MEPIDARKKLLDQWLEKDCELHGITLHAMPGDASFRRYFRVMTPNGSYVAMDAPPPENCRPFIAIAQALRKQGLHTPEIIASHVEQGFLLISDFGDATYLNTLTMRNADELYQRALNALSQLQHCRNVKDWTLPFFQREFMWQEWTWFKEWFLKGLLGLSLDPSHHSLEQCFLQIVESAASQPQVFMHRDFHSANLMALENGDVGILDFQDAFVGPVTYDLVSLLRDCYIDWPNERVITWVHDYQEKLTTLGVLKNVSQNEFLRWFDWMGVERHLKALFTFARKYLRDQKPHYLKHIPRTLNYLIQVSHHYPELIPLHDYLSRMVKPLYDEVRIPCVP